MGNCQPVDSQTALLRRMARLLSKKEGEKLKTLEELRATLNPSHPPTNRTRSQEVLDNKAVMDVLLGLSATTRSTDVAESAFGVLRLLAYDLDNAKRLLQEHPGLVSVAMHKLTFWTENVTEGVQVTMLGMLQSLAVNVGNARDMVIKNPTLVSLIVTKVESNSERVQVEALGVLQRLASNVSSARDMVVQRPTLVPLLVDKVESHSEQVQIKALVVLGNLATNDDNAREMVTQYPVLVFLLTAKVESNSEQLQAKALDVLGNLAHNNDNARDMATDYPALVPLLVARVGSYLEPVRVGALRVLQKLATNDDNAREMAITQPTLVPLLVEHIGGSTVLPTIKVVYVLSRSPTSQAILRGNNSVVAALTKGREDQNTVTSLFSLLALVNLFGAEEDSKVLKTDLAMLQWIFQLVADKDVWKWNSALLAFRYLCVVERNRQLLWSGCGSEFLSRVFAVLQHAIRGKATSAVENAVSTLAQFSSDPEPLVWMRSKKPQLDQVFAQLAPFPEALKTAQFFQLTLDPPKVIAAPVQVAGTKPTIMISYSWEHQAHARLVHSLLESLGYPVWRDEQNMTGNIVDGMIDAVKKSTVVLVLVSFLYKESVNCQMECKFARNNNRKLVPVLVEPGYVFKADGWLGLMFRGKVHYDVSGFHNEAQMKPVVLNLLRKEVEGDQPVGQAAMISVEAVPMQSVPQGENEIRQWLSKHENGKEVADRLVRGGLVNAKALEMLSNKSLADLKAVLELNVVQALTLEAALKEVF